MQVALREVLLVVCVYRGRTQSRKFPATEPRPLAATLGLNRELSRELVVLENNPEVLRVSRRSPRRMSEESTTQRWISGYRDISIVDFPQSINKPRDARVREYQEFIKYFMICLYKYIA